MQTELLNSGNQPVNVSVLIFPPDVNSCILTEGLECARPGYEMELFWIIATTLKIKLRFLPVPDGHFGSYINGSWNGIIAHVLSGEAAFSAKLMTYTASRASAVDFCDPVKYTKRGFMIRNTKVGGHQFSVFAMFKKVLPIIVSTYLGLLVIGYLDYWYSCKIGFEINSKNWILSMAQQSVGVVLRQPFWLNPRFATTRAYYVMAHLLFFFLYLIVCGFVLSDILPQTDVPFYDVHTLASQIKSGEYRLISSSSSTAFFSDIHSSDHPDFKMLRAALEKQKPLIEPDHERLLNLVATEDNLVFVHVIDVLRKMANNSCSKYLIIQDRTPYTLFSGFVFPKGSPYRSLVSNALRETHELAEDALKRRYFNYQNCDTAQVGAISDITTIVIAVLCIHIAVAIASVIICMIEYAYYVNGKRKKNNKCNQM